MGAINQAWETPVTMKTFSRDELIEDRVRHIIPQLERAERLGRHEYVKLSPVDATVLAIVLKEKAAELTMKRYATDKEEAELYAVRQPQVFMNAGVQAQQAQNLAAQQIAHIKAHQAILTQGLSAAEAPKKRKFFNF